MRLISLACIISLKYHLGFWDPNAGSLTLDCCKLRRIRNSVDSRWWLWGTASSHKWQRGERKWIEKYFTMYFLAILKASVLIKQKHKTH